MRNVYPSYKKFFHEVECRTSLAFYEQYPFPSHLQAVTEEELAEFLRFHSHNTCSIKRAVEIISLVEKDVIKEREYQYARNGAIQSIVRNIRFNNEEMKRIEKIEAEMLKELNYQLETIPGVSTVTASALVDQILYFLAIQQVYIDKKGKARNPEMRAYFEYKTSKGKTKIQALICIMRRLVRIVFAMMKYKTAYEMPEIKGDFKEKKISWRLQMIGLQKKGIYGKILSGAIVV